MSCPECGGKLISETRGSSRITTCTECGWSVATSYIDPIYEDESEYAIYLTADNASDKATLSAVSKVCNCNFLEAKRLLDTPGSLIFAGSAVDTAKAIALLKEKGVSFSVQPEWPY